MRLLMLSRDSFASVCLTVAIAWPVAAQDTAGNSTLRFTSPTVPAKDQAPATEEAAPAAEEAAPAVKDAAPATEDEAPAAEDAAPRFVPPQIAGRSAPQPARRNASPTTPAVRRVAAPAPVYTGPSDDRQITSQTRRALGFYGGYAARATLNEMPRRTPVQPAPPHQSAHRPGKPFQARHDEPTVSPYLNLYRDEERSVGIPNYFTYVRPQLEQLEANRMQQRDLQQLRGQLQSASAGSSPQFGGQRAAARYMDTAQFYRGRQR